jgi:hypothetical protein
MMIHDVVETKRGRPPDEGVSKSVRPREAAPTSDAALGLREAWSRRFVAWFLDATGGDEHPDGGPAGHRWRMEYFDCVRDPQAFERYAEKEIEAYAKMKRGGE